jgi:hypothetical protein
MRERDGKYAHAGLLDGFWVLLPTQAEDIDRYPGVGERLGIAPDAPITIIILMYNHANADHHRLARPHMLTQRAHPNQ